MSNTNNNNNITKHNNCSDICDEFENENTLILLYNKCILIVTINVVCGSDSDKYQ